MYLFDTVSNNQNYPS